MVYIQFIQKICYCSMFNNNVLDVKSSGIHRQYKMKIGIDKKYKILYLFMTENILHRQYEIQNLRELQFQPNK